MPVRPEVVSEGLGDLSEPLHQHHGLDQLHVTELRVPVDVGRAHQDVLPNLLTQERVRQVSCHFIVRPNSKVNFQYNRLGFTVLFQPYPVC